MNIEYFYKLLEGHDWFYQYSDDHSVWKKGSELLKKIIEISKESEQHKQLYTDYCRYINCIGEKPLIKEYNLSFEDVITGDEVKKIIDKDILEEIKKKIK